MSIPDTGLRIAFGPVVLGCALLAAADGAQAQTADPAPAENSSGEEKSADTSLQDVVVVGSRIRRDTFNAPSPVQIVTREETTLAGFSSTADALQGTGITTGAAQINNAFGGFVTDGGPGANTISLRGLGAGRSLVLINGRRVSPSGTRGAVGSADLNVLPTAITDRVEVLRDGASSIYGSDAVAGVVNVITLNKIQGLTFEAQLNQPTEGAGQQSRLSMVGGTSGDRWTLSGSLDFYKRNDLTLADRDWTECNQDMRINRATGGSLDFIDPATGQPKCYPVTTTGSNGVTINTIGTSAAVGERAPGAVGTTFNRFRPNANVLTGVVGFEGVGGGQNNINVRDTFDPLTLNRNLISPAKVYSGFLQSNYDLEAMGNGQVYFELLANKRDSEQTGYRQLSLDYRKGSPLIPANLAFSTFAPDQGTSGGSLVGVRAFIGFGNDHSEQAVDFYKPTLGVRGDLSLPFVSDWKYDLYTSYAKSDATYRQQSFLTDKVTFASDVVAAPAGTDAALVRNGLTCAINVTNPAERCIPYPQLNADTIAGRLPQDFVSYIFRGVEGKTKYDESIYSATVDGPLFDLPAGKLQSVFGIEHRRAEIDDTPDPNSIAGNLYNLTSATPTRGKDNVSELYTEVEVPILAKVKFADTLTFNGSFRYTDYDSYGNDTTYKLGLVYSPISWVSFRATEGTSFRAPALFEQFQGPTSGFLNQTLDPCNNYQASPDATRRANCASEGLPGNFNQTQSVRSFSEGGAAAGLVAETSDNSTYGVIFRPKLGSYGDLDIAIDYFKIEINNGVDQPGAINILPKCYDDPDFRAGGGLCRLVTRNATTGALTVSNAYTNIATQAAKGVDYTLRYENDAGPGRVRLNTQLTRYISQPYQLFPEDPTDELNGTIGNPKWSGTADLTYTVREWKVRYGIEWIGSMNSYGYLEEDPATTQFDYDVSDYVEHFASVRYTKDSWQATLGVKNIFNEEPDTISSGFYNRVGNAPLYSGYDYVGREAFVQFTKSF